MEMTNDNSKSTPRKDEVGGELSDVELQAAQERICNEICNLYLREFCVLSKQHMSLTLNIVTKTNFSTAN